MTEKQLQMELLLLVLNLSCFQQSNQGSPVRCHVTSSLQSQEKAHSTGTLPQSAAAVPAHQQKLLKPLSLRKCSAFTTYKFYRDVMV